MLTCERIILGMIVIFSLYCLIMNTIEIYWMFQYISQNYHKLSGDAFDCYIHPLVPQLCVGFFLAFTIMLCLFIGMASLCCYCLTGFVEGLFVYGLYTIYGPCLLCVSLYFLMNISEYNFSCTPYSLNKVYSYKALIISAILGCISILITFGCCIRKLVQYMSRTLRNDSNCFTKLVNAILFKTGNSTDQIQEREEAERQALQTTENQRNQL